MSAQGAKKKRVGSRRRAVNQNQTFEPDELQHHIPEEHTESLHVLDNPDDSLPGAQSQPSPEIRRKFGSSRKHKGRQHVQASATESYHKAIEEVEDGIGGNETPITTQMSTIQPQWQEEINQESGHVAYAPHSTSLSPDTTGPSPVREDMPADQGGNFASDGLSETDKSDAPLSEKPEAAHNGKFHNNCSQIESQVTSVVPTSIIPEITTELICSPGEITEPEQAALSSPAEELTIDGGGNVILNSDQEEQVNKTEKLSHSTEGATHDNTEDSEVTKSESKDGDTEDLKQDDLYLMQESLLKVADIETSFTPEIPIEKHSFTDQTGPERFVEQEVVLSPNKEFPSNEEQSEMSILAEVKDAHCLGDSVSSAQEQERMPTDMHLSAMHDDTEYPEISGGLIVEAEVSSADDSELNAKIFDSKDSCPENKQDEPLSKESNCETVWYTNDGDTEMPQTDPQGEDPGLGVESDNLADYLKPSEDGVQQEKEGKLLEMDDESSLQTTQSDVEDAVTSETHDQPLSLVMMPDHSSEIQNITTTQNPDADLKTFSSKEKWEREDFDSNEEISDKSLAEGATQEEVDNSGSFQGPQDDVKHSEQLVIQERGGILMEMEESDLSPRAMLNESDALLDSQPLDSSVEVEEEIQTGFRTGSRRKLGTSRRHKERQQLHKSAAESNLEYKESASNDEALETTQTDSTSVEDVCEGSEQDSNMLETHDSIHSSEVLNLTTTQNPEANLETFSSLLENREDEEQEREKGDSKEELSDKSLAEGATQEEVNNSGRFPGPEDDTGHREKTVHQEQEMEKSESSSEIMLNESDALLDSQPLDSSMKVEEQIHTGFSATGSRRKLATSRRYKGRLQVQESAADYKENTQDDEVIETTQTDDKSVEDLSQSIEQDSLMSHVTETHDVSFSPVTMPDYSPKDQNLTTTQNPEAKLGSFSSKLEMFKEEEEKEADSKEVSLLAVGATWEEIDNSGSLQGSEVDVSLSDQMVQMRSQEDEGIFEMEESESTLQTTVIEWDFQTLDSSVRVEEQTPSDFSTKHDATEIMSSTLIDEAEVSCTFESELDVKSSDDFAGDHGHSNPLINQCEPPSNESNFEALQHTGEDDDVEDTNIALINYPQGVDPGLGQVYEGDSPANYLIPSEDEVQQEKERNAAEMDELSLQTTQTDALLDSQPLDSSERVEKQTHAGFSATGSRKKLGTSRRYKEKHHAKDSDDDNTRNNEPIDLTKTPLELDIAGEEESMETTLDVLDTAQTVDYQVPEDAHVETASLSTLIVDQELIMQPSDRENEESLDGSLQANLLLDQSHVKSEERREVLSEEHEDVCKTTQLQEMGQFDLPSVIECESSSHTLEPEMSEKMDSQPQTHTGFSSGSHRRKMGSSRRNKGRQHVKDPSTEIYRTDEETSAALCEENKPQEDTVLVHPVADNSTIVTEDITPSPDKDVQSSKDDHTEPENTSSFVSDHEINDEVDLKQTPECDLESQTPLYHGDVVASDSVCQLGQTVASPCAENLVGQEINMQQSSDVMKIEGDVSVKSDFTEMDSLLNSFQQDVVREDFEHHEAQEINDPQEITQPEMQEHIDSGDNENSQGISKQRRRKMCSTRRTPLSRKPEEQTENKDETEESNINERDTAKSEEHDEENPEGVNIKYDQAEVPVVDFEILNSVVRGGAGGEHKDDSTPELSNIGEGTHGTDLEMDASPTFGSVSRRRKMGSTRRTLRSRDRGEDVDNVVTEVAENVIKEQEEFSPDTEDKDGDLEERKEKLMETVDLGETHLNPPILQTLEENPSSHVQPVATECEPTPVSFPAEASASPKPEVVPVTAGGRRRKLGSNRRTRGNISKETSAGDKDGVTDAATIETTDGESSGQDKISEVIPNDKKPPTNISTSGSGEHPGALSENKPAPESPVQHPRAAGLGLGRESQNTFSLAGSSGGANSYNVVMIGDSNVGKTSFMKRAQSGKFSLDLPSSIGLDSCVWTVVVDGKPVVLKLWDTAGQERFHSITRQIFHRVQAFLLMYDITSAQSFAAVSYWANCIQEGAGENVNIVLLGNKSDSEKRQVETAAGESLAKEYKFGFLECSAATGENVIQSLETVARMLSQNVDTREETTVLHKEPKRNKSSGCC